MLYFVMFFLADVSLAIALSAMAENGQLAFSTRTEVILHRVAALAGWVGSTGLFLCTVYFFFR